MRQTYTHWTASLVHDAEEEEDDQTRALAQAWVERDPRFRLSRPGRVGLVGALNHAMSERGDAEFLARFDGDDICHPDRLTRQTSFLRANPEISVVDCRSDSFRSSGDPLPGGMARYQRWHDGIQTHDDFEREFLVENPVCHPAAMMRADALELLAEDDSNTLLSSPYRDGDFPEDYDLWLRLLRGGARFHKLTDRLLQWRDHDGRTSRVDPSYRSDAFFELKWDHFQRTHIAPDLRLAVWGGRGHGKQWVRALVGAGSPPIAVVDINPRSIGSTRQGIPVVAPEALASLRPDLLILAVGSEGARTLMEQQAEQAALRTVAVAGLAG